MSQLTGFLSERPKETLPNQSVANPRNSSQTYLAQKDQMNQCNLIHILRSGKQVDNQVSTPSSSTQASTSPSLIPPQLNSDNTKKDSSAENVHKSKEQSGRALTRLLSAHFSRISEEIYL